MSVQHWTTLARRGALLGVSVLALALLAACGSDSGTSATNTPGAGAATTPTSAPAGAATASTAASAGDATPTAAVPAEATATEGTSEEPTATPEVSAVEPTATTEGSEEPTATTEGDAEVTPSDDEDPLADYQTLDPEKLPNFSLAATIEIANIDETGGTTNLSFDMQQAAVDNYHVKVDAGEDTGVIETWKVGDQAWYSEGGTITEVPAEAGDLFGPSMFLQQMPDLTDQLKGHKVGEDRVSGRKATHYQGTGEEFMNLMGDQSDSEYLKGASNVDGTAEIWIDNEYKILLKADIDISWDNSDGTKGSLKEIYEMTDIGDTAEVQPPQ